MVQSGREPPPRAQPFAIEQEIAKELLLIYQQRRGASGRKFGGRKLETEIYNANGRSSNFVVTREDLDKWLSGRTRIIGDSKFKPIEVFIMSDGFSEIVPEVKSWYDPLRNTVEIGCAFSQVYGYGKKADSDYELRQLDGTWVISPYVNAEATGWLMELMAILWDLDQRYTFMCIRSISGLDFSVVHFIHGKGRRYLPGQRASGFLFHKGGALIIRVWDRSDREEWRFRIDEPPVPMTEQMFLASIQGHHRNSNTFILKRDDEAHGSYSLDDIELLSPLLPFVPNASKTPYYCYRTEPLLARADTACEDDPLWYPDLQERAEQVRAAQFFFDSFLCSVVGNDKAK